MEPRFFVQFKTIGVCVIFWSCVIVPSVALAQNGCRSGASALANAYVRANPMYAYFFGDIESYVANNRKHFGTSGDSIRCARALSNALVRGATKNYDPSDLRRQRELNARLGSMGISPGISQPTASQQLYTMGLQFARLARVLPPAANGDYRPLHTPTTELEQMQLFGAFPRGAEERKMMAQLRPGLAKKALHPLPALFAGRIPVPI